MAWSRPGSGRMCGARGRQRRLAGLQARTTRGGAPSSCGADEIGMVRRRAVPAVTCGNRRHAPPCVRIASLKTTRGISKPRAAIFTSVSRPGFPEGARVVEVAGPRQFNHPTTSQRYMPNILRPTSPKS